MLRVHFRVAINLTGGGLEDSGLGALGQAQHVDRTVDAGLGGLHRVPLVVDGRCRAGQVVDFVDLDKERKGHVVAHQLEMRVTEQMGDIILGAAEEVVEAKDVAAFVQQAFAKMRA